MLKRVICFIFAVSIFTLYSQGQEQYKSSRLREIAQLLEGKGRDVVMEQDSISGITTHIGLPISIAKLDYPFDNIVKFVQQYGLYCSLLDERERAARMKSDKVVFDLKALCRIDTVVDYSLNLDNEIIQVTLNNVYISFPNDWQLISGMNKIECEEDLYNALIRSESLIHEKRDSIVQNEPINRNDYVVEHGPCYLIKEINQDKYYVKLSDNSLRPIFSSNYASESISNLMQHLVAGNFTIKGEQNLYGYKRRSFEVPLSAFVDCCSSQHCQPYIGIESENSDSINVVVVYCNPIFNYNHLLYLDVDKSVLENQEGILNGILYCYIPTQNLKNLFKDATE